MQKEKLGALFAFILSIILFLSSFFLIYSNEIILDKDSKKTKIQERIYYSKFYLSDYLVKASDYKNSVVLGTNDSGNMVKWIIRFIGIFGIGFAITLFSLQIFPDKSKDILVKKSFIYSFVGVIIFIIFLKIYLFYLSGGFNFDFSWFYKKGQGGLSFIDKFLIILIIIIIFLSLGMLYNYMNKKDGN